MITILTNKNDYPFKSKLHFMHIKYLNILQSFNTKIIIIFFTRTIFLTNENTCTDRKYLTLVN